MPVDRRTIVFGVTIDYQLRYHDGLYQRLADEGWAVHLIAGHGPNAVRFSKHPGITVHKLEMVRNPAPWADLRSLSRWVALLRDIRPDVVVVGTPKAGLLGSLASRFIHVPVRIYELHGLRLESARGGLFRLLKLMEQLACLAATQVIAVGQSLRDRAIDGKLVSARKITVLGGGSPNGVDVDRLARAARNERAMRCLRAELGIADDDIIVTFVGRVTADKGIESLARAMADLEVDSKFRLLVVGGIDDESGRRGESKLRAVLPRVSFVGEVADVAPYLAISNVFCLPSRREGLPTVVLEAFAAGIPVVATAATGIIDLVANGETGRLVAIDSPTALAEALREAVRDIDGSETMALAAYRLVKERYAQEVVQLRWIEAIKRNVERQSGKSDRAHRPTRFSPADAAFRSGESRRRRA